MTFQQLQYFLEVHKAGTFSQAAKNLFVTTSSVSITISNLEKELGYPLFIRTQKGLSLTANGQKVLDHATHICERYRQLGNIQDNTFNSLHISTANYAPTKAAIVRFLNETDDTMNTNITVLPSSKDTLQKIALFEIDIGIIENFHSRNRPLRNMLDQKGLSHKVLDIVPVQIILGKGHKLFHTESIDISSLESEIFIDTAARSLSRSHYLKGIINIPQENVIAIDPKDIQYTLLSKGIGYTLSRKPPDTICEEYGLRCIPLNDVFLELVCVTNPTRPLNPMAKRFLSILDEEIRKHQSSNI